MIAWMVGCVDDAPEPAAPSAVPALEVTGPIVTAPVIEVAAEVPPRFTAVVATPRDEDLDDPDRDPPTGMVQHGLCAGEGPWRDQLSSAVRALAVDERWRFFELTTQPWCRSPGWCGWLGAEARALGADGGAPFFLGLATCDDPAAVALVEELAPDDLYVQWALVHPGPYRPRLGQIAARVAGDPERLPPLVAALQRSDGPEATGALLGLVRTVPPAVRDAVAAHLGGRDDPQAERLYRAACAGADHVACDWVRPEPLEDLVRAVRLGVDPDGLFARYPNHRSALLAGLERCLLEQAYAEVEIAVACAHALARQDPGKARAALAIVAEVTPELDSLGRALATPALAASLRELGFAVPDGAAGVGAVDLLAAAGLAVALDDATSWPPRHERLLYRLADAAGLEGVAFDELVPSARAPMIDGRIPRTALFAWLDGVRLRTLVEEDGVGWDTLRAVGLVNAVLARRGVEQRIAIEAGGRTAVVGSRAALEALEERGLVVWTTTDPP